MGKDLGTKPILHSASNLNAISRHWSQAGLGLKPQIFKQLILSNNQQEGSNLSHSQ